MSIGIGSLGHVPPPRFEPTRAAAQADDAVSLPSVVGDRFELSSTPPPEASPEIDAAYSRALELAAHNRELHFAQDERGAIYVQVRDLDGRVIRTIPNSEVFDILAGAEL